MIARTCRIDPTTNHYAEVIQMNVIFLIAFAICLISYILHTIFHVLAYRGSKLVESNTVNVILMMPIGLGYFCWGLMLFTDPIRIDISKYIAMPLGLTIGVIGTALFLFSAMK
jgi:hypothetical protein